MYPVSANFHTLAIQDAPKTRVRIYFIGDAVDCTDDNAVQTNGTLLIGKAGDTDSNGRIGQNGVVFNELFNPDKNIQIGRAVSSQIGMTLLNTDGALDNFAYGRCKVYLDVYDTANSAWLTCPMGVYIIELPTKRKVQLINAVGFDQMTKLDAVCDTWWSALNWSGGITLSQLLTSLATQIGVSVSSNTASAIVNGSVSFTEEPFQCVEVTYREVLEYIAEATGAVARFDRNGALDLRWFAAAKISGNTVTVNTDTVGNQCLAISVSEYSVAAVDLLKVKLYTDDIGTTVGTGTNQYTIVNNLFLDGANSAAIIAKATPIYNRLHGLGAYSPVSARIITDWSIEAGDIINIVNDSTTYSVPIFQQSMAWRGGYVVSDLLSDGDNVRPVLDYDERTYYRLNSEMSKKVGDNEIISKINQSPESITIQANKVNLTGYVTFTNLSTDGQTSISGGNIITRSITADKLNANNINASKTLTVGAMTDAAAATVLNSNIAIGGRNICTGTATAKTLITEANQNYFNPSVYPLSAYSATALSDANNTQVTVSFDYSITGVDTAFSLTVGFHGGNAYSEIVVAKSSIPIGSSAGHAEATKNITNDMRQYAHEYGVLFSGSGNANANAVLTVSNLKVEIGNKATTWTQAPEDVAADIATAQSTAEGANSQEQLIYISKASGTTTQSATTTWITDTTGNQNTWTIKRPVYNSSYPVLFVATQRKNVAGTVTCTTPQIDNTTTVIDGGHITTGTIDASVVNVSNINADNIKTGTLKAITIQDTGITPSNYWDLSNGNFVATNGSVGGFTLSSSGLSYGSIRPEGSGTGFELKNKSITFVSEDEYQRYITSITGSGLDFGDNTNARPGVWKWITGLNHGKRYIGGTLRDYFYISRLNPPDYTTSSSIVDFTDNGTNFYTIFECDVETRGNATVTGVLDVTKRRCYATLSSAGWYRVLEYSAENSADATGGRGLVIKLNAQVWASPAENHSITVRCGGSGVFFVDESSKAGATLNIDKIRYTYNSSTYKVYVDIHYAATSSNDVGVDFAVSTSFQAAQSQIISAGLSNVAASPSGETVLTEYSFAANTAGAASLTAITSRGTITSGGAVYVGRMVHLNFVFTASVTSTNSPQIAGVPNALYDTALSAIDITSGIASAITAAIPCGVSTLGRIYLQSITSGHIYAITGDYMI